MSPNRKETKSPPKDQQQHLVIDIGNTHTVIGVFKNNHLENHWRINTKKNITADEVILILQGFYKFQTAKLSNISYAAIASVVPAIQGQWKQAVSTCFSLKPFLIQAPLCSSFTIDIDVPEQTGADRLCNVLACQALGFHEAIIIDFGTATTFDIYKDNHYKGGLICPGIYSSLLALTQKASKLSEVELYWNDELIGKNSDDALRNGVLYGTLAQVDGLIQYIKKTAGMSRAKVLATGGLASLIGKRSSNIHLIEEDLTLMGLNYFITLQLASNINV
ncbi:MAG: type III pantothenate kinase [Fibrobacteria bacterium]|nr:type III pantothenate kinase [Fibrobacteria bacterium]